MEIFDQSMKEKLDHLVVRPFLAEDIESSIQGVGESSDILYSRIPENKRGSYGIVFVIETISNYLFTELEGKDLLRLLPKIFERAGDHRVRGVTLGLMANYSKEGPLSFIEYFKKAAASDDWIIREHSQFFFRRVIHSRRLEARQVLRGLSVSKDPRIRRFVAETLRPVKENRWFYDEPEYPLSILRGMFKESEKYPRTAVGNNLSDLSRKLPELIFDIVKELVASSDPNSYWIAYRACRNLVRSQPNRVLDALGQDVYKYKKKVYERNGLQGD